MVEQLLQPVFLYRFIEARDLLIEYLDCESGGAVMECSGRRSEFEDAIYPTQGISDLSVIGAALSPFFFLIYVVPFRDVKKKLRAFCSKT